MANGDSGSQGFPGVRQLLAQIAMQKLRERSPLFQLQLEQGREDILTSQQARDEAISREEREESLFPGQLEDQRQQRTLTKQQIDINVPLVSDAAKRVEAQTRTIQSGATSAEAKATIDSLTADSAAETIAQDKDLREREQALREKDVLSFEQKKELRATATTHFSLGTSGRGADLNVKQLTKTERESTLNNLMQRLKPFLKDPNIFGTGQPEDNDIQELQEQILSGNLENVTEEFKFMRPYFDLFVELQDRSDIAANQPGTTDEFKLNVGRKFRAVAILDSLTDEERIEYRRKVEEGNSPALVLERIELIRNEVE